MTTRLPPPFDKLRPETAGPSGLDSADLPADPVYGVLPDPDAPDDYEAVTRRHAARARFSLRRHSPASFLLGTPRSPGQR